MAGASPPLQCLQVEVTCSVCLDYYKDPVTINCGHSFCNACLSSHWEWLGEGEFSCPQCGKRSRGRSFKVCRQLANITEIAKQMQLKGKEMTLCDPHGEGLTLFCKEDQTFVCVLCKEAEGHKAHTVVPAEEAAQESKVQLHKVRELLKEDLKNLSKWRSSNEASISIWEDDVKEKKQLLEHSFKKALQLLKEEKILLLRRLDHEHNETLFKLEGNMTEISTQRSSVKKLITEIEAKVLKPSPELLRDTKSILTRRNNLKIHKPAEPDCELHLNYCLPGILEMLRKYAVQMTLDPDTAHSDLIVSEDGKHIRCLSNGEYFLGSGKLPGNLERLGWPSAVLGTWKFASGRHYWEIEYTPNTDWEVGVCLDSVTSKEYVESSSDHGFWTVCVGLEDFPVEEAVTHAKIGIFLDYEAGEVTFYNVAKRIAICTYSDTFSGILRPLFKAPIIDTGDGLTMCPVSSPV